MIAQEPGPGSVITWRVRFASGGSAYQYTAFRVAGRGWFTSSTRFGRALMWTELCEFIGDAPAYVAVSWAPIEHVMDGGWVDTQAALGWGP